jgi:hypothetical protein
MITIISNKNGSGLEKDIKIISDILCKISDIEFRFAYGKFIPLKDNNEICIFIELVDERYYGKYNILIPNQEWFFKKWLGELNNFNAIYTKTKIAYEIFSKIHKNVLYTGFTSLDMYKEVDKIKECFHTQGKSIDKGTNILSEWNSSMPKLNLITRLKIDNTNINIIGDRLDDEEFIEISNKNLIHICPSTVEGWGHYINESKSMSNVVVTTNAEPMNQLIKDSRFLCDVVKVTKKSDSLGIRTETNIQQIELVLSNILDLDLIEIGKQNRIEFLENDKLFKETIIDIIRTI